MRIYLDVCCLNRPFDKLDQERVRREAEAVKGIMLRIGRGVWHGVRSTVADVEIGQIPDTDRLIEVGLMAGDLKEVVVPDDTDLARALEFRGMGFGAADSLHLACAESAKVDVFLTTDDALLRMASRFSGRLTIKVENPATWFKKVMCDEDPHA